MGPAHDGRGSLDERVVQHALARASLCSVECSVELATVRAAGFSSSSCHLAMPSQDEQPKKKLKPSTKGLSFLDSLPKPLHDATPPAGTALGAGSAVGGPAWETQCFCALCGMVLQMHGSPTAACQPACIWHQSLAEGPSNSCTS